MNGRINKLKLKQSTMIRIQTKFGLSEDEVREIFYYDVLSQKAVGALIGKAPIVVSNLLRKGELTERLMWPGYEPKGEKTKYSWENGTRLVVVDGKLLDFLCGG